IAVSIGCTLSFWKLHPGRAGWEADIQQLEQIITPHTRLLVLNIPNNPTGYLPTQQEFEAIVNIARKHGIMIFSDEMYRSLEYQPADRLPAICDVYEHGISLSGLSKSYALPGLRIGWLASQDGTLMDRWLSLKDYTTICNSAPSEILALIAVQNNAAILQRNLEIIKANLKIADQFFGTHSSQFVWHAPRAGSIAFPEWTGKKSIDAFCQDLLNRYSMMIVSGNMFDYAGNHFRIGLGRKNFHQGIDLLNEYCRP
ncbi:MAG TPA: aminotransferase class I/II-fold pyridoxal phosphate-dependent enzyme, partial [Leptolinea sp.]